MAFMTNTGREKSSTWPFVYDFICPQLARAGLELQIIKSEDFNEGRLYSDSGEIMLPGFTDQSGSVGKLSAFCSGRWKIDVGERFLRSRGIISARNWIGISLDEMRRVRKQHRPWLDLWYPLIFGVPLQRHQCVELIRSEGWAGHIPHSACYMCPNMGNAEWIDMKLNWPEDFRMACEVEAVLRKTDSHFYLHPSCVPLAEVDFFAQESMFSERGCVGGCFT
jgi:hypothetical protein